MSAVEIIRGSDATIDVKFQGLGATLENHTITLLDVSSVLLGKASAAFESYTAAAGQTPDESVIRVTIEGTDPIPVGRAAFRVQATSGGASVSSRLIPVQVV
jgi:hypothetical protein